MIYISDSDDVNGTSELWIADQNGDLESVPYNSIVFGNCEYRKAADYGYGYNFLVSYGDNNGTVLKIKRQPNLETVLMFYKHTTGGKATIKYGDITEHIDTYSETSDFLNILLPPSTVVYIIEKVICLIAIVLLSIITYPIVSALRNSEYISEPSYTFHGTRDTSIDIVRTAAAFFVVLVHSFLADGYYNTPIEDPIMIGMTVVRWIALLGVPLFMLLTGFLCIYRVGITKNWLGFLPGFVLYVLITIICDVVIDGIVKKSDISFNGIITDIIGFTHAWYVKMYLGLVIMMPFLNWLWQAINDRCKKNLVASMLLLTALGTLGIDILPSYFSILYPVTYYFIGAYLRENPITMKNHQLVGLLIIVLFLQTIFTVADTNDGLFNWTLFGVENCNYNSFIVVVSAVLVFTLLSRIKIKNAFFRSSFHLSEETRLVYI